MPRIPQLESNINTVAANPGRLNSSMPARSMAGVDALAKSISDISSGMITEGRKDAKLQEQLDREKELVNAQTAWNKYEQDAKTNLLTLVGTKAYQPNDIGLTPADELTIDSTKQLDSIKGSINDEHAKVAFEKWVKPQQINLYGSAQQHAIKQRQADDKAAYVQNIQSIADRVATDNTFLFDGIKNMQDVVRNYGESIGMSAPERELEISKYSNHFKSTVLNNVMRTDPAYARDMLDVWKADGSADEKLISQYDRPIEIRYQTQQVLGLPSKERKSAIDAIEDSDVRDKVKDEIKSFEANRRFELNEQAKPVVDYWDKYLHEPKNKLPSRQDFIDQIYSQLPDEEHVTERHGILAMYDSEVHRRNPPKEKEPEGMKELMRQIRLARFEAKIAKEGIVDPNAAFRDIRSKQNPNGILEPGDITEARTLVKHNAEDPKVGKFVTDFSEEKKINFKTKEDRQLFERDLSDQVREARKTNPNLDDKTIRAIGERRLKTYTDDRWFGSTGIPLLDRQTRYESEFYNPTLAQPGYKSRQDSTPLLELVNEVKDPKGKVFSSFGKDVRGAYADPMLGVVRFKSKGREYAVRLDGTVGEIINTK